MAEIDRIKGNVKKLIASGAEEKDIDEYVASEGVTIADLQAHSKPPAPVPAGEMAADVAKSAGIGVVQGGIGLATLPGNLEALGRLGINYGASKLGLQPLVDRETKLPTYNDWKPKVESVTGEFYEPKTTAGKYARTIGEFASPGALGGISRGVRAASHALAPARVAAPAAAVPLGRQAAAAVVPGAASEAAGQASEGTAYEPFWRIIGGLAGSRVPGMVTRAVTPAGQLAPGHTANVNELTTQGVNSLSAGQRVGDGMTRWIEDVQRIIPFGGRNIEEAATRAGHEYTRAALRAAGVHGDVANGQALNRAAAGFSNEFNNLAIAAPVVGDARFVNRLQRIATRYTDNTAATQHVPIVRRVVDDISNRALQLPGGTGTMLTGAQYLGHRSDLARALRGAGDDHKTAQALREIIAALDAQLVRSLPRAQRAAARDYLRDLNTRYRNFTIVENAMGGAGKQTADGIITPAKLRAAVQSASKRDYTRDRTPLARLAKAGESVLRPMPSSGTAERNWALRMMEKPGQAIAGIGAGNLGMMLGGLPGAVAAPALTALLSRGVNSGPFQRYISADTGWQQWLRNRNGARFENFSRADQLPLAPFIANEYGANAEDEEKKQGAFQ